MKNSVITTILVCLSLLLTDTDAFSQIESSMVKWKADEREISLKTGYEITKHTWKDLAHIIEGEYFKFDSSI